MMMAAEKVRRASVAAPGDVVPQAGKAARAGRGVN